MNLQECIGMTVAVRIDEPAGNYWTGTILSIDDENVRLRLANESVFRTTTDRLYMMQPIADRAVRRNELFETEGEWKERLDRRDNALLDREAQIADREEKVDDLEGEIAELKRQNEVVTGQRNMCFKRLRKIAAEREDNDA